MVLNFQVMVWTQAFDNPELFWTLSSEQSAFVHVDRRFAVFAVSFMTFAKLELLLLLSPCFSAPLASAAASLLPCYGPNPEE